MKQALPPPARNDRLRCDQFDARSGLRCTLVLHPGDARHFYVSPGLLATARVPLLTDDEEPAP